MNILVVTNGMIDDQICFLSLMKGLKKKHKDSKITVFCHKRINQVYKNNKNVYKTTDKIADEEFDIGVNFCLRKELLDIFDEINVKERIGFSRDKKYIAQNKDTKIIQKGIKTSNLSAKKLLTTIITKSNKSLSEWFCEIAEVEYEHAEVTQRSECHLAEVDVGSSNLLFRL